MSASTMGKIREQQTSDKQSKSTFESFREAVGNGMTAKLNTTIKSISQLLSTSWVTWSSCPGSLCTHMEDTS